MARHGANKKRTLLGSNKGLYSSEEDVIRQAWQTEDVYQEVNDYINRLNTFSQGVQDKIDSLTGEYSDKDVYSSLDPSAIGRLNYEYETLIKPFV